MRLQRTLLLAILVALVALSAIASSASAATTVGDNCPVSFSGPRTMVQSAAPTGPSYTVPTSGILTRWGINASVWGSNGMVAATFSTYDGANWTIQRQSPFQQLFANTDNSYTSRVPVVAGETLGMVSYETFGVMCPGNPGDVVDNKLAQQFPGNPWMTDAPMAGLRLGVWATIEPDVDNDGYGDETQDGCPQSAALQNACPVLSISQKLSSSRSAISVLATASVDTSLTAEASVRLPKIGRTKAKTVKFKSKATAFSAGKLRAIKLKLPSSVRKAVSAGKKLKVTVTLTGNGLANTATTKSTIRLKR